MFLPTDLRKLVEMAPQGDDVFVVRFASTLQRWFHPRHHLILSLEAAHSVGENHEKRQTVRPGLLSRLGFRSRIIADSLPRGLME
jgi:hypothetical protein